MQRECNVKKDLYKEGTEIKEEEDNKKRHKKIYYTREIKTTSEIARGKEGDEKEGKGLLTKGGRGSS